MLGRTIFIWDVHWCYEELKLLLKKLTLEPSDRVFFVWDYINKWPHSYKVLKLLYKNRKQFFGVLWNHDRSFLEKVKQWQELSKQQQKLLKKLNEHPKVFKHFSAFPYYIEEDNFILIHAWLNPQKTLSEQSEAEISSIRIINKQPWYNFYTWEKKVIYGHWAMQGINIRKHVIGLDSGCCYWWYLTAYILETGELIQQWSLAQYEQIDYTHINPSFF